jgi:hypothetical protein
MYVTCIKNIIFISNFRAYNTKNYEAHLHHITTGTLNTPSSPHIKRIILFLCNLFKQLNFFTFNTFNLYHI